MSRIRGQGHSRSNGTPLSVIYRFHFITRRLRERFYHIGAHYRGAAAIIGCAPRAVHLALSSKDVEEGWIQDVRHIPKKCTYTRAYDLSPTLGRVTLY